MVGQRSVTAANANNKSYFDDLEVDNTRLRVRLRGRAEQQHRRYDSGRSEFHTLKQTKHLPLQKPVSTTFIISDTAAVRKSLIFNVTFQSGRFVANWSPAVRLP
jgi:hypothetical protein